MDTLDKALRSNYLYDFEHANVIVLEALKRFEVLTTGLQPLRSESGAPNNVVPQLSLPAAQETDKDSGLQKYRGGRVGGFGKYFCWHACILCASLQV